MSGILHQHCQSEKEHIDCTTIGLYLAFHLRKDYGNYMQINELCCTCIGIIQISSVIEIHKPNLLSYELQTLLRNIIQWAHKQSMWNYNMQITKQTVGAKIKYMWSCVQLI